jgi:diaminopimelate decarboxylase
VPVAEPPPGAPLTEVDVVGPVCESGDVLGAARKLPQLSDNALIAIMSSGAYGAAMASEYNSRPLVCEVMARGGAYAVVRPRPGLESLVERDRLPPWLAAAHGTRSRGVA